VDAVGVEHAQHRVTADRERVRVQLGDRSRRQRLGGGHYVVDRNVTMAAL
jgi:hypothetical protein